MAQNQLYNCYNLNEVVDFSKKTYEETKAMVNEILCKQIAIGNQIVTCFMEEIVSRLTGKMTLFEIDQVVLSFLF